MTPALALAPPIKQDAATRDARHKTAGAWPEVAQWLAFRELESKRPRTLEDDERAAARLLREWPRDCLDDYTAQDLADWLRSYPPGSRRKNLSHIRELFRWAEDDEEFEEAEGRKRITRNPTRRLPKQPRPDQKVIDMFSDVEIELLTGLPMPDGALFQILFDAGLRKGEARRLKVENVNLETRRLTVYNGKGGKDRLLPIGERLSQCLADMTILEGLQRGDYFWWCRIGGKIKHDREIGDTSFQTWYGRCIEAAGVEYRNPHTTRHTFATRWLRRTHGNFVTLKKALGHASIQTTVDEYGHLVVDDVAADLLLVEGFEGVER